MYLNILKQRIVLVCAILISIAAVSCRQGDSKAKPAGRNEKQKRSATPPGYDLTKPVTYKMSSDLAEISGIAFNNGDNQTLYAEEDEDGKIFYLHLGDKEAKSVKFAKHGDYEDMAIGNSQAVILRSDGEFHSFPLSEVAKGKIKSQKVNHLMPEGEYESMMYDNDAKKLYVLCKHCDVDKSTNNNSGYIFDLSADGDITKTGGFNVEMKDPRDSGNKSFKFRPSGFAKNPRTKQWFILSSVNKMLVVTDDKWKVQAIYPLKGMLQPEGIAFDSDLNLYISNEGDELTNGNVLFFKYSGQK